MSWQRPSRNPDRGGCVTRHSSALTIRPGVLKESRFQIVRVGRGLFSVRDAAYGQTCHPGVGPSAEAEELYVRQTHLDRRLSSGAGPFVIWDVGLGTAANAVAVLKTARSSSREITLLSFDRTLDPLGFALEHQDQLPHLEGWVETLASLMKTGSTEIGNGSGRGKWTFHGGNFPALIRSAVAALPNRILPAPDLVLYDPYSPAANAEMWTLPLFSEIHSLMDPSRPCLLPTYSRSTFVRVTLLLAGFWVGAGKPTGAKEETTLAASDASLLESLLDQRWLARALRSHSAEPLVDAVHHQLPLSGPFRKRLCSHPQFAV